jgi:hypothetical protein
MHSISESNAAVPTSSWYSQTASGQELGVSGRSSKVSSSSETKFLVFVMSTPKVSTGERPYCPSTFVSSPYSYPIWVDGFSLLDSPKNEQSSDSLRTGVYGLVEF